MIIDYAVLNLGLIAQLRERDNDPSFDNAPVLDGYSRISAIHNAGDEEKTDRQTYDILLNIMSRHARLGEILCDEKRSAWKRDGKRPDWDRLLERISKRESDGVVCWHTDRLMRQPWDLEALVRIASDGRANGVIVGSCYGDRSLDNEDDLFMLRILTAQANKESADKSRRLKRKNEARRLAGDARNGPAAFGHVNDAEIDAERLTRERDAVRWGIETIIAGGSLGAVADEWNERGLLTRAGCRWNPGNVRSCVLLERHAGLISHETVEYIDGKKVTTRTIVGRMADAETVRIVDEITHAALRAIFASRTRGRSAGESEHWLSGFIRCDRCNLGMVGTADGTNADGSPRRMYRCPPRDAEDVNGIVAKCRIGVDAFVAERWAAKRIAEILTDPTHARMIASNRRTLSDLDERIHGYEQTIDRLMTKARSVHISRAGRYHEEIEAMESILVPLLVERERLAVTQRSSANLPASVEQIRQEIDHGSVSQRRQLAKLAKISVYVIRIGRSARLRGADIEQRLSLTRNATQRGNIAA